MRVRNQGASGDVAPLTRREREKRRHRREVLEAAERVFADKGFERATMEDVAREAEFFVGAIYTFFSNKEKLRSEVMVKIAMDFLDGLRRTVAGTEDPLEAIGRVVMLRLGHVRQHGRFLRLFMESRPGGSIAPESAVPRNCRRLYDTYLGEVAALLERAMAGGALRRGDPLYVALGLEGVINAFSAYWSRNGISLSLARQAAAVQRNFLAYMLAAEGSKAE
jgi:TetR/AcrR family transcriptional regulator